MAVICQPFARLAEVSPTRVLVSTRVEAGHYGWGREINAGEGASSQLDTWLRLLESRDGANETQLLC